MAGFFNRLFKRIPLNEGDAVTVFTEADIPPASVSSYAAIISRVLPYFNQLNDLNKQKFLKRVYNFKIAKTFYFHGVDRQEEIEILISAAAIQVSFGLKSYMLPFFK